MELSTAVAIDPRRKGIESRVGEGRRGGGGGGGVGWIEVGSCRDVDNRRDKVIRSVGCLAVWPFCTVLVVESLA